MWLVLAILSAVFAALTSILAKIGISGVDIILMMIYLRKTRDLSGNKIFSKHKFKSRNIYVSFFMGNPFLAQKC